MTNVNYFPLQPIHFDAGPATHRAEIIRKLEAMSMSEFEALLDTDAKPGPIHFDAGPGTPAATARTAEMATLGALSDFSRELVSRPKLPGLPTSDNDAVTQVKQLKASVSARMDAAIKEIIASELHGDPVDPANYPAGLQRLIATRPELAAAYERASDGLTSALIPAYHAGKKLIR